MSKMKILIVDDEQSVQKVLKAALNNIYEVFVASQGSEALDIIEKEGNINVVVSDIKMKPMSGIELLEKIKEINAGIMVVMMTAFASVETAVDAMKKGAYEYVMKPFKIDEIRMVIERALEQQRTLEENRYLREELRNKYKFDNIVGNGENMQKVYELIYKVANIDTTVLLYGESGTGKELVAKAIHYNSHRKERPFVAIDCGALTESILESELFGHVKGSFTGAISDKKGLLEGASGGTVFLDEINSISTMMQAKLLRVLQEKEIKRVGDVKSVKIDTRIIAATNVNLEQKVEKGGFREDLFYRLNVILIEIPPLRERKEDIPLLVKHFLDKLSISKKVTKEVESVLLNYNWPGNVRELENIIERGAVLSGDQITLKDIPEKLKNIQESTLLKDVVSRVEESHIKKILQLFKGDKKLAAKELGLDLATLYRKLQKLDIKF